MNKFMIGMGLGYFLGYLITNLVNYLDQKEKGGKS
jgi:hypothetical protein